MDDPLDRDKLRELLDLTAGDPTWLLELLQTYADDTRNRLQELSRVVMADLVDPIQREAHGIKGSSSNIGASRMARLCHEMEQHARQRDPVATRRQLADIEAEFGRIVEFIRHARWQG